MSARYARLADTIIREQWQRACKINIRGEGAADTSADGTLADGCLAETEPRPSEVVLPNGYCGSTATEVLAARQRPIDSTNCPLFVTTAEFLPPIPSAARRHHPDQGHSDHQCRVRAASLARTQLHPVFWLAEFI